MNTHRLSFLLLVVLALFAGGCTPQPPAKAQTISDAEFTLTTAMEAGRMVFVGVGGEIDGATNPDLLVRQGDMVLITLTNGDGMPHDFAIPELNAHTSMVTVKGDAFDVVFEATGAGEYTYYCTVAGHRQMGMEGRMIVREP